MSAHPRRRGGRLQPRLHLPEGRRPEGAARGPGPRPHAAGPDRHGLRGGLLGRRVRGDRPAADADTGAPRPRRGRRLPRQPERPQPRCAALRPRAAEGARHAQHVLARRRSTRCPSTSPPGLMFGTRAQHPDPRRRPHRSPADAGREPARLERQPADGARHARPAARRSASAAGKIVVIDPRRSRTAEDADEHHFIRPGTDAHLLFGIVHVLFEEGLADPGALAEHVRGLDEVQALAARLRARGRAPRRAGSRPARSGAWRASWPAPSAPRSTGGSAPARRSSARSRAGSSTC